MFLSTHLVALHVNACCAVHPEGWDALVLSNLLQVAGVAAVEAANHHHQVDGGVVCDLIQSVLALLLGQWGGQPYANSSEHRYK